MDKLKALNEHLNNCWTIKEFVVTVTNGIGNFDKITLKKNTWVYDLESAKRMAESKINSAWEVVEVEAVK